MNDEARFQILSDLHRMANHNYVRCNVINVFSILANHYEGICFVRKISKACRRATNDISPFL